MAGTNAFIIARLTNQLGTVFMYVLDAVCFVYTCRRLIDLSPIAVCIYMPAIDRSLSDCRYAAAVPLVTVSKTRNVVLKTIICVSKTRKLVLNTMDFAGAWVESAERFCHDLWWCLLRGICIHNKSHNFHLITVQSDYGSKLYIFLRSRHDIPTAVVLGKVLKLQ